MHVCLQLFIRVHKAGNGTLWTIGLVLVLQDVRLSNSSLQLNATIPGSQMYIVTYPKSFTHASLFFLFCCCFSFSFSCTFVDIFSFELLFSLFIFFFVFYVSFSFVLFFFVCTIDNFRLPADPSCPCLYLLQVGIHMIVFVR